MADVDSKDIGPNHRSKSGQQRGAENVESLRSYLDDLRVKGGLLPSRNGKPDKSAIAIACGFDRQTFYNNPEARALLEKASNEIGVGDAEPPASGRTGHLEQLASTWERRAQLLEVRLHTKTAEAEELRRERNELKERLRQYEILEEIMTSTGRKFRP